jgi:8-oxo-dGTP pyrophosphatase MutT (NUDIX family)
MRFSLAEVARRLAAVDAGAREPWLAPRRAGVALVLREVERDSARDLDLLVIRRAEDPRDRWSGHMALPGGRRAEVDRTIEETAIRETREEVGIDLAREGRRLGRLGDQRTLPVGLELPLVITPVVFSLEREPALALSTEVAEALWVPLGPLASGALDSTYAWRIAGTALEMPCWRYRERVIWGLTYKILRSFFEAVS